MRSLAIWVFALVAATAGAQTTMYKCVGASGTLSYSDSPCEALPPAGKASGAFSTHLLIVKSHDEIEKWVVLEPAKRRRDTGRTRTVSRGTKVFIPVVATFAESQIGRRVLLVADLEVTSPNGKTTKIPSCCHANRVDPRAPATIVLSPVVDLTFDAVEPPGEFRVRAMISNGTEIVTTEEKFRLQ